MFEIFKYAFNAVASILLLSLFGFYLKQKKVLTDEFCSKLNSISFRYFLSTMIFYNVYNMEGLEDLPWKLLGLNALIITALFLTGIVLVRYITPDNRKRSVLAQSFFRSNSSILGIPLAALLGGAAAEGIAASCTAVTVLCFNIYAVMCFSIYSAEDAGRKVSIGSVLRGIIRNPIVIALICGVSCLCVRALLPVNAQGLPVFSLRYTLVPVYNAIGSISRLASPLMLIVLGTRFDFSSVRSEKRLLVTGVLIRNILAPTLGFLCLYLAGSVLHIVEAGPAIYQGEMGILASPLAVSSAVMAAESKADDRLASQLIVWSSVCSIFTLFIFIVVLRAAGLM